MSNFVLDETFMKLSKKMVVLGAFALVLSATSGLIFTKNAEKQSVQASVEDGYTVYHCDDLGFDVRNSGDTRVVKSDVDAGPSTIGNVLSDKCEIKVSMKQMRQDWWFGVGGYAIYVSGKTSIRFLALGYSDNGNYSRSAEKTGMTLKTSDGSTDLLTVISSGEYFSDYVQATLRFDLSDWSHGKMEFFVEYQGVTYYTFDGANKVEEHTFSTYTPSNFPSDYKHKAMLGANASGQQNIDLLKFQSHEKSLDDIITAGSCSFHYSYIDNFYFNFNLSEQIFGDLMYFNDHAGVNAFKDAGGNFIDILNGIIINGQTFGYWKAFDASDTVFPRNDGVTAFPMNVGGVFSPISIEVTATTLEFKTVVEYIPMDGMTITFKAGVFAGYCNGVTYILNNDLTFYSVISTSGAPTRVILTKDKVWEETRLGVKSVDDWGEETASHGGKFHRFAMWTNIPRDTAKMVNDCPADNYRYVYDNILLNGRTISHYQAWARGNSKDFTNLSDPTTQNPAYELGHPTGNTHVNYDLAIRVTIVTDQPNYVFFLDVPNQLVTDLSLTDLSFALRDGSDWFSLKGDTPIMARYDASGNAEDVSALETFLDTKLHMTDYTTSLGYCNDNEHHYYLTAKQAYGQLSETQKVAFQNNPQFAAAKARYEAWATFNNDAAPYDGNNSVVTPINSASLSTIMQGSNAAIMVIAVMAILSISAIGVALVLKKKKQY